jgi:drug/metabolite transporter (DMT)-like permease
MKAFGALPGPVRGAIWMVMAGISLTIMAVDVRHLAPKFSVLEMIFIRSLFVLAFMLPWAWRVGLAGIATRRPGLHIFRNVIHYLGNLGWFVGVTLISLADVSALQFTVPLFTVCMAALILHETIGPHRWIATLVGFLGMLVIVRPGYIPIGFGTAAVLTSAVFYAISLIAVRKLSFTEPPNRVLFYMAVVFVPISAGPAMMVWVMPGWADFWPIVILGVTGWFSHFCIIRAFTAGEASFITPFDFLRLPVSAGFGWLLYEEVSDVWTWAGAVVIFAATYYNTWRETSGRRKAT